MMKSFPWVIGVVVSLAALVVPVATGYPDGATCPTEKCPDCLRPSKPEWQFCPYDGSYLLMSRLDLDRFAGKGPREIVYLFLRTIAEDDDNLLEKKKMVAATTDLEGIVTNMLQLGIGKLNMGRKRKDSLQRQFVPEAARALVPVILRVLVSEEVRKNLVDKNAMDYKNFRLLFQEEITGDTARVFAADPSLLEEVYLRKVPNGATGSRWVITKFPEMF